MDQNDSGLRNFNEGRPMQGSGMRRLFPIGIGAAILIVAAIIFSSAAGGAAALKSGRYAVARTLRPAGTCRATR